MSEQKCDIPNEVKQTTSRFGINLGDMFNRGLNTIMKAQDVASRDKGFSKVFSILKNSERMKNTYASWIRESSAGYEKLSSEELKGLVDVQIAGDKERVRYSNDELKAMGLSDNQIEAYNGYIGATNRVFETVNRANIENIKELDPERGATQEYALDRFVEIANSTSNKEEMRDAIRNHYEAIKDQPNAKEIRDSLNNLAKDYTFGYMVRNRGEGGHFIEIKDSTGKLIHKEKVSALDLMFKKDELFARAKEVAQKNLESRRISEAKSIEAKSAKYLEYRQKAMEKMTPKAFEYLTKIRDGKEQDIKVGAGDEKDFKLAQQMFRRDKMLNDIMKQREDNQIRTLNEPTSREIKAEEISTGTNPFITIEHIDNAMKAEMSRFKRTIEAKKNMSPSDRRDAIEAKQAELNGTFGAMKLALEKEAQGRTFKRHKMKRASEFISGVNYDNPQYDLVHYINQGSKAAANIKTQAEAYKALSELKESGSSNYGFGKKLVEDYIAPDSTIDKVAGKIGALNFAIQFAGNVNGAIVNAIGNLANASGVLAKEGLSIGASNGIYMKNFASATKIVGEYMAKKMSNPNYSFAEFMKGYNGYNNQAMKAIVDKAISEGLAFDINAKEFGEVSNLHNMSSIVYRGLTAPMALTERVNRIATVMSAAEMALKNEGYVGRAIADNKIVDTGNSIDNIVAYADYLSSEINGEYGKLGRNYWETGKSGVSGTIRAAFPFMTYVSHQMMGLYPKYLASTIHSLDAQFHAGKYTAEEMKDFANGARAFLNMNVWMTAVGGIGGNIALSYITSAYDKINEWVTGVPSVGTVKDIKSKEGLLNNILGYGIPGMLGVDVTGSTDIQTPYIAGSYLMSRFEQSDTMEQFSRGNYMKGIADNFATPAFVKRIDQAVFHHDLLTDRGQPIEINYEELKRSTTQDILHALGVKSTELSEQKQKMYIRKGLDSWVAEQKKKFNEDFSADNLDDNQYDDFTEKLYIINQMYGTDYKASLTMGKPKNYIFDEGEED